jgi:hypothetical protein
MEMTEDTGSTQRRRDTEKRMFDLRVSVSPR